MRSAKLIAEPRIDYQNWYFQHSGEYLRNATSLYDQS